MKLACSEDRERRMAAAQSYPSGICVHFAQWLQNTKQAASCNFWMNNPFCFTMKKCFFLKTEG